MYKPFPRLNQAGHWSHLVLFLWLLPSPSVCPLWSTTLRCNLYGHGQVLASLCGNRKLHGKLKVCPMAQILSKGLHMDVLHAMAGMMVPYSLHIYWSLFPSPDFFVLTLLISSIPQLPGFCTAQSKWIHLLRANKMQPRSPQMCSVAKDVLELPTLLLLIPEHWD